MQNKIFLISGWANKKSIAHFVANNLLEKKANLIFTVQNEEIRSKIKKYFPNERILICDVEREEDLNSLAQRVDCSLDGFLHSMAYAEFSSPHFHETSWESMSRAFKISGFSLIEMSNKLLPILKEGSSIVTLSISDLLATTYGMMGPIKAFLQYSVPYLAKSLSFKKIRVNSVGAGPLKTSASAGIPGYLEKYLFAGELTLRKDPLKTKEVAEVASFLLSDASSGINATCIPVDLGMRANYFEENIVKSFNDQFFQK